MSIRGNGVDRAAVERSVRRLYAAAKFKQPKAMVWVDSPLAGAYARFMLSGSMYKCISRDDTGGPLGSPFWVEVERSVLEQLPRFTRFKVKHIRDFGYLGGEDLALASAIGKKLATLDSEERKKVDARRMPTSYGDTLQPAVRALISTSLSAALDERSRTAAGSRVPKYHSSRWAPGRYARRTLSDFTDGMVGELFFMLGGISAADGVPNGDESEITNMLRYMAGEESDELDSLFWVLGDVVVLVDKPVEFKADATGRVHSEEGAAIVYPDGFSVYAWHGTNVPKSLVTGSGWSVSAIRGEWNVELRRCAIERMGWDVFIEKAKLREIGSSVADPGNPGQMLSLYHAPEVANQPVRLLLCENATLERDGRRHRFGITVPVTITDPVEAAAWTFGVSAKEYATLQRAT